MVRVIQSLVKRLQFRLKPGLSIKGSVLDLVAEIIDLIEGCIKSILVLLGDLSQVHAGDFLGGWDVWLRAEHGKLAIVFLGNIVGVGSLLLSLLFGLALGGFLSLCDSSQSVVSS